MRLPAYRFANQSSRRRWSVALLIIFLLMFPLSSTKAQEVTGARLA